MACDLIRRGRVTLILVVNQTFISERKCQLAMILVLVLL